jgi:glyoxylase-like metal-dependent hydrolase (beta-lactamase superfamily II)
MQPRLIPTTQDIAGLDRFIGSWVCVGTRNVLIDVGPACAIGNLVDSLLAMKLEKIDLALITHIHIDHAGGLADFLDRFPDATVVCHAKGIRHLVEPERLWEGSLNTLGDLARRYGPIRPVPRDRFIPHTEFHDDALQVYETPGHAQHHLSFTYQGNLFAGEAGGVRFMVEGEEYLRPATPPVFFMQEYLGSMDRLLNLEDQPICYAHSGRAPSSHVMLRRARDQVLLWHDLILGEIVEGNEAVVERCVERLFKEDPELRAFRKMKPQEQERERFFMANCVKGFLGYLQGEP